MWFFTGKWKCQELTIHYYSFACNNFKTHYDNLILQHALVLRSIYQENSMPVTIPGHKDFRASTTVLHIRERAKNDCLSTGSSTGAPWLSVQYAISNLNIFTLNYLCNASLPVVVLGKKKNRKKKKRRTGNTVDTVCRTRTRFSMFVVLYKQEPLHRNSVLCMRFNSNIKDGVKCK